ncbi:hypothetical protein B0H10DRAFT_2103401 [Mycena sp. CBHHK59/15]|nr:hypothetical protein B0H10DRAFT_2103401 [Mycena sp. CBHHK59/15]
MMPNVFTLSFPPPLPTNETSGTGWTDPRASKRRRLSHLLANDHDLVEWDGHDPKLILDADGRIVAVLLGRPEGENWDAVIAELERLLEGVRLRGLQRGVFKAKHRISQLLQLLTLNHSIRRIAGFQSSGFSTSSSQLYKYYCDALGAEHEDGLNAPHGMCGVTSTSDYNHTLSGHIYLKQLKLVIEKLDTP